MSHIPVNHPLRPFYRVLTVIAALYVVVFGAVGIGRTASAPLWDRSDVAVLGLRTNLGFSIISVLVGGAILMAVIIGRNVDATAGVWGGIGFMVAGLAMLTLIRTDLNVLNFSMTTVIVSFVIGMVLFSAGLYVRSGTDAEAQHEEAVRHGQ
jgi:Domain of unknown function (DUF4383)